MMPAYYVQIGHAKKVRAELHTTRDRIACTSGDTVHFEIARDRLAAVEQRSHDSVLVNFFEDADCAGADNGQQLVQVVLWSKNCLSITDDLVNAARVTSAAAAVASDGHGS